METTIEAKTLRSRASSDDAFLERVCAYVLLSLFFVLCSSVHTSLHTLFSYFFARFACIARPKQRKARPPSPSLSCIYIYMYTRNKSHLEFFFLSRAISLTASLRQEHWMVSESKKRRTKRRRRRRRKRKKNSKKLILCLI